MNTKNNQRYQDTEKLIQDTLLSLAQEKEIHKVTVRAICEAAHINRSSFYLHYLDIHDLIDKMGRNKHCSTIEEDEMWYHFSFFKAGFISVLSEWLHRGCPETPKRLSEIILRSLPAV